MGGGKKEMSTEIDERVVEMDFDNRKFERGVTISPISYYLLFLQLLQLYLQIRMLIQVNHRIFLIKFL